MCLGPGGDWQGSRPQGALVSQTVWSLVPGCLRSWQGEPSGTRPVLLLYPSSLSDVNPNSVNGVPLYSPAPALCLAKQPSRSPGMRFPSCLWKLQRRSLFSWGRSPGNPLDVMSSLNHWIVLIFSLPQQNLKPAVSWELGTCREVR